MKDAQALRREQRENIRQDLEYAEQCAKQEEEARRPVREAEAYLEARGFRILGFVTGGKS